MSLLANISKRVAHFRCSTSAQCCNSKYYIANFFTFLLQILNTHDQHMWVQLEHAFCTKLCAAILRKRVTHFLMLYICTMLQLEVLRWKLHSFTTDSWYRWSMQPVQAFCTKFCAVTARKRVRNRMAHFRCSTFAQCCNSKCYNFIYVNDSWYPWSSPMSTAWAHFLYEALCCNFMKVCKKACRDFSMLDICTMQQLEVLHWKLHIIATDSRNP